MSDSSSLSISLRVPDQLAIKYALPGAVPADRINLDLMSLAFDRMSRLQRQSLLEGIRETVADFSAPAGEFPVRADTSSNNITLSASVDNLDKLYRTLQSNLIVRGLFSFITDTRNTRAVMAAGNIIPASYHRELLDTETVVFSQLAVEHKGDQLVFDFKGLPDELMPVENIEGLLASVIPVDGDGGGARFRIPLLVPEGVPTGDGRIFKPLSVTTRDLPIPLLWQMKTGTGHDGSVLVGRIDHVERVSNGLGNAHGVFDTGMYGKEAERLVRSKMLRGVSADLDLFEAADQDESDTDDETEMVTITKGRVLAATVVVKPAFQECSIELLDTPEAEEEIMTDGVYTEQSVNESTEDAITACALVAAAIPVVPPNAWFSDPQMRDPAPLHVTDDGRVFGHIALWHVAHLGLPGDTRPPHSASDYSYYRTGVVRTDTGSDVHVGQLTLAGGHAALNATAQKAIEHYDRTQSAVADVTAGEDDFGIWVAGALRPEVTPEQIRTLRASSPSGDWRPIDGRLELVAVCQVNVPGFPVARARVASGTITALVAAGASAVAQLSGPTVEDRVQSLETSRHTVEAMKQATRFAELAEKGSEATLFRNYSREARDKFAEEKKALPDGSYPISNIQDLKNAIRAVGRSKKSDRSKVRKHIIKRARSLGKLKLIPDTWSSEAMELELLRMEALTASMTMRDKFKESDVLRDQIGRFREKIASLRKEVVETGDEEAAVALVKAEEAAEEGQLEEAQMHADRAETILERFESGGLSRDEALKEAFREVGAAAGHAGLEGGIPEDEEVYRFTDLPDVLQKLVGSLIDDFTAQAGKEIVSESLDALLSFISGGDLMTVQELQASIAKVVAELLALKDAEEID